MKKVDFTCDKCKKQIANDGVYSLDRGAGNGWAIMGDNRFPDGGFHYHYGCFSEVVGAITKCNEEGEVKITYV